MARSRALIVPVFKGTMTQRPYFAHRRANIHDTSIMQAIDFDLRGEHIALDALLKATGVAPSGGVAKARVAAGEVRVDGAVELRKTCKIRAGQTVTVDGVSISVRGA